VHLRVLLWFKVKALTTKDTKVPEGNATCSVGGIRVRSRIILRFPMAASLNQIVAATRCRVANAKRSADLRQLEQRAERHAPRGFRRALATRSRTGPAVIAELKKASPSRGLIRANFDPESLAGELEAAGATALSVLTDEEFFQGSLHNLERASARAKVPCLQKDFVIDEFQLLQARAYGADAILLIAAVLSQAELIALSKKGRALGLDVLCEAHNEVELRLAVDAGSDLIGVNNRDLRTFEVDVNTALRLAEMIPHDVISVAESGIDNGADIARLRAAGYQAFLIGESLMKAESPGEALQSLIAETEREGLALNNRDQKLVL
jgi:indole-3-glycerol phosphate synthase